MQQETRRCLPDRSLQTEGHSLCSNPNQNNKRTIFKMRFFFSLSELTATIYLHTLYTVFSFSSRVGTIHSKGCISKQSHGVLRRKVCLSSLDIATCLKSDLKMRKSSEPAVLLYCTVLWRVQLLFLDRTLLKGERYWQSDLRIQITSKYMNVLFITSQVDVYYWTSIIAFNLLLNADF